MVNLFGTDVINHFDLPRELKSITGSFKYRFFEPAEQIEEDSRFANNGLDVPRYIEISWSGKGTLLTGLGITNANIVHRENLFFPSDLNSGYSTLMSAEAEISQTQDMVVSDASTGSKLDYLLKSVASNEFTEELENNLDSDTETKIPVLDPTTGVPIVSTTIIENVGQPSDIMIRTKNVAQILNASNKSPLSGDAFSDIKEIADVVSTEAASKAEARNGRRLLSTFYYGLVQLGAPNDEGKIMASLITVPRTSQPMGTLSNWSLVGYCLSKYRIEEGTPKYLYSRVLFVRSFKDPYVAYGKNYRYELRPIYGKYINNDSSQVVLLASDESAYINIACEELKSPNPPKNLKFEYILNNNIRIKWQRPNSYVHDENKAWDTDDIKGYQIFIRNSLLEPYKLYRYFTFNNTFPRSAAMYASELISDDYIISSEYDFPDNTDINKIPKFYEFKEHILDIRANTDYYFAMCSIDAHGNSSNYSAQYKVRRNNVTGEVDINLLCPEGAPKQYPNLLVPGKLVDASFKSSGYQYMDVYFAPDSKLSVPNVGQEAVNIQMFELETQIEKNIIITIKEEANTSN
tara:strand:- start:3558 stop:5285 length:1728 start_codon:yes stop_codon:yes gene_type:complete